MKVYNLCIYLENIEHQKIYEKYKMVTDFMISYEELKLVCINNKITIQGVTIKRGIPNYIEFKFV